MNCSYSQILSCYRDEFTEVDSEIILICNKNCNVLRTILSRIWKVMHICFGIFLYNMEIRGVDPVVACEKIKLATDQRFSCYDREEESISLRNYDYMRIGY